MSSHDYSNITASTRLNGFMCSQYNKPFLVQTQRV